MKKAVLVVSLLGIFMPTNPMNFFLKSINPSGDEKTRGIVGAGIRKVMKDLGYIDQDLLGLGDHTEKERTLKIYDDLEAKPNDPHLQKQFTERQAKATQMALSLAAQLEEFSTKMKAQPSSIRTEETSRAFQLIEVSLELRKLHAKKSLAPTHSTRLLQATNQARKDIKTKFGVTDRNDANQAYLLKEEPLFDEETIEAVPRKTIMAQALKLLRASHDPNDSNEKALALCAIPLLSHEELVAQLQTTISSDNWTASNDDDDDNGEIVPSALDIEE